MAVLLSDQELAGLAGLPHAAIVLYVMALRPRMNIRTGRVGESPRLSWAGLAEWVYQEPRPGPSVRQVSTDSVRRLAGLLESVGLLRRAPKTRPSDLVFSLPCANVISLVQNTPARHSPDQSARPEAAPDGDFGVIPDRPKSSTPATHRCTELTPSTYQSSSSSEPVLVDAPGGGEAGTPENRPPQGGAEGPQARAEPSPDSRPSFELESPPKASVGGGVVLPACLNPDQVAAINRKVSKLRHRAQDVADELAGHMAQRVIENPVRYVDYIIEKAIDPEWIPELAAKVRAGREAAEAARARRLVKPQESGLLFVPQPERAAALAAQLRRGTA